MKSYIINKPELLTFWGKENHFKAISRYQVGFAKFAVKQANE